MDWLDTAEDDSLAVVEVGDVITRGFCVVLWRFVVEVARFVVVVARFVVEVARFVVVVARFVVVVARFVVVASFVVLEVEGSDDVVDDGVVAFVVKFNTTSFPAKSEWNNML